MTDLRTSLLVLITKEIGSILTTADDPVDAVLASDLGCDSLHRVSIMVSIEEEFGIEISDREDELLGPDATIRELLALVEGKMGVAVDG